MTSTLSDETRSAASHKSSVRPIRVALLGLGRVGAEVAALARRDGTGSHPLSVVTALVRDVGRPRPPDARSVPLTADPAAAIACGADVVVEVLGGLEPARTLVRSALERGTPVVTANKSLLAAHGDELFDVARRAGAPLLYEASVIAGVPFLTMFNRRPRAREVTAVRGIVNGTSNYILSRMSGEGATFDAALADAQRLGYAEPDASKDVNGEDAAEKLAVLVRPFGGWSVRPAEIATSGIAQIEPADLEHAAALGGALRPIVDADWDDQQLNAYAGPAFVASSNPLSRIDGVENAITIRTRWSGELFFSGPGAGPTVTAATVLDDVVEAQRGRSTAASVPPPARRPAFGTPAESGWFVRLKASDLQDEQHARSFLGSLGIRVRRASTIVTRGGVQCQWLLTAGCSRPHLDAALDLYSSRLGCRAWFVRALE